MNILAKASTVIVQSEYGFHANKMGRQNVLTYVVV